MNVCVGLRFVGVGVFLQSGQLSFANSCITLGLSARVEAALLSPCVGCLNGRLVWLLASHSLACLGSLNNWACRRSRSWGLPQSEGCGALQGGGGSVRVGASRGLNRRLA